MVGTTVHICIVRHGECLGQCEPFDPSPDSALSARGEQQAYLTARRFTSFPWKITSRERDEHSKLFGAPRASKPRNVTVISSPLVRSLATASAIREALHAAPIEVWTELREIYDGSFCGPSRTELQRRFPHVRLPDACADRGWDHGDPTYDDAVDRAHRVLSMLKDRFTPDDRVIIVMHEAFASMLAHTLLHVPATTPSWLAMANCGISYLRLIPAREQYGWPPLFPPVAAEIAFWNDTSHLQVLDAG